MPFSGKRVEVRVLPNGYYVVKAPGHVPCRRNPRTLVNKPRRDPTTFDLACIAALEYGKSVLKYEGPMAVFVNNTPRGWNFDVVRWVPREEVCDDDAY